MILMTDYKDIFEKALSEACEKTTFSDNDELFSIVKERTGNMEKKKFKIRKLAVIAASIAIIAAAALTVSVGAASNWTFRFLSDFSSAFDNRLGEYNIVESASYSNSVSDMRFELVGVAADSNVFSAMVDIFPPYGTEFTEENKPKMNDNIHFDFDLIGAHVSYGSGGRFDVLSDTPQKVRVLLTFNCSAGIENKEIGFYADKMIRSKNGKTFETERIWCTNIKTGSMPQKMIYDLDEQKILFDILPYDSYVERAEMTVTGAEVGSMSVKLTGLITGDLLWNDCTFSAKKTDGATVGLIFSGGHASGHGKYPGAPMIDWDGSITLLFDEVVDPADIVSVTVNDTEFIFK